MYGCRSWYRRVYRRICSCGCEKGLTTRKPEGTDARPPDPVPRVLEVLSGEPEGAVVGRVYRQVAIVTPTSSVWEVFDAIPLIK